jgi:hypothetical protein
MDIAEMIPTIAFHGAMDTTVLIEVDTSFLHYTLNGSLTIHDQLKANDICSEITVDPSGEHGIYRNTSSLFRAQRASCFFKSVFCNDCTNFYATDSIPFSIDGFDGDLEVTIYNTFGQLVYNNEKHRGLLEIDLIPGIYFLSVRPHNFNMVFKSKLIKQ